MMGYWGPLARLVEWPRTGGPNARELRKAAFAFAFFYFLRLNKFKECNVSSQATAWFKK